MCTDACGVWPMRSGWARVRWRAMQRAIRQGAAAAMRPAAVCWQRARAQYERGLAEMLDAGADLGLGAGAEALYAAAIEAAASAA